MLTILASIIFFTSLCVYLCFFNSNNAYADGFTKGSTGTHDTGSSMYPLKSDHWNGNTCIKCIRGENGNTIIDLQIDDKYSKHLDGWFINMDNKVLDHFVK